MQLRRSIFALCVASASVVACQWLVGIEDDSFVVAAPDATMDAADAAPRDLCPHAVPGSPPVKSDSDEERSFVFAVSTVDVTGRRDGGDPVGFDLDGVCSCDRRDPRFDQATCVLPASSRNECDGDGGVDNASAELFDAIKDFSGSGVTQNFNHQITCGRQSIMVLLSRYNGLANDGDVVVGLVESYGIRQTHDAGDLADDAGCFPDGGGSSLTYLAKHDGTDVWTVPPGTVRFISSSPVTSTSIAGYVKDFQLVFDGNRADVASRIPIVFGSTVMTIGTPVLSVKLVPLDASGKDLPVDGAGKIQSADGRATSFRLTDGLLSGRAGINDALAAAGTLLVSPSPTAPYLCHNKPLFGLLKTVLCAAPDTTSLRTRELKGDPCDAVTLVLQFNAVPANVGWPFEPGEQDAGCPRDTCDAAP
jgi:hypothetical protein